MVYKRYIYRNGKKFGPYYYHTYRDEEGRTHSRYISNPDEKRAVTGDMFRENIFRERKTLFILLFAMVVIILTIFFLNYQLSKPEIDSSKSFFSQIGQGVYSFITGFTAEEPPDEEIEEPSQEPIEEQPEDESFGEPVDETAEETSDEEVVDESILEEQPFDETQEQSINEDEDLTNKTIEEPSNETIEESNETTEEQIIVNKTINDTIKSEEILEDNGSVINESTIFTNETLENVTTLNVTNETQGIFTTEVTTKQFSAVLGKPVKWEKRVKVNIEGEGSATGLELNLPKDSGNVLVKKKSEKGEEEIGFIVEGEKTIEEVEPVQEEVKTEENKNPITTVFNFFLSIFRFTARVVESPIGEDVNIKIIDEIVDQEEIIVEYETPAPYALEIDLERGKEVKIIGYSEAHYENVLSFTEISESLNLIGSKFVKIYWKESDIYIEPEGVEDRDSNGIYDYVEWVVPSLSNQSFEIIVITAAEHLNENRIFISDIYEQVKELDNVWSETIPDTHYVRVTFEKNLTNENDITIYPRIVNGAPRIEVYEKDLNEIVAEFNVINDSQYNKVFLINLIGEQDVFDLLILNGDLEFDHIIDPTKTAGPNISVFNTYLRPTSCQGEDGDVGDNFTDACDGTYPSSSCGVGADFVSCDDSVNESMTATAVAGTSYAGVKLNISNSSITNCASITQVVVCYEWWITGGTSQNCRVTVSNGTHESNASTFCPGSSFNPGVNCSTVTSNLSWGCGNFFNPTNTESYIESEFQKGSGLGSRTGWWDVLYYNVTYTTSNTLPTHDTPSITPYPTATTDNNLTASNVSTSDVDGDLVTNIYNWKVNSTLLTILNMPFDTNISVTTPNLVKDYSGNGNNGTLNSSNVTWVNNGRVGGAYNFSRSVDSLITINDSASLRLTQNLTVMAWINLSDNVTDSNTNHYTILAKKNGAGDANYWFALTGQAGNLGKLHLYMTGPGYNFGSKNNWNENQWYFVAATYNNTHVAFYVDGVVDNIVAETVAIGAYNADALNIGAWTQTLHWFNGTLDEIKVFNRSLSASQIYQIYLDTRNGTSMNSNMTSSEIRAGENWTVEVTPNDGIGDGTLKLNWTVIVSDNIPTVTLSNPSDGASGVDLTSFICNTTDDINLKNVSLYGNWTGSWHLNQTTNISGTSNSTNFTNIDLPDGTFVWNCLVYDNSSQSAFASSNFTVTNDRCGLTQVSSTTTLTKSQCEHYNITSNNVVFSCGGYTVFGHTGLIGNVSITAKDRNNITVKDCILTNWSHGISFSNVTNSLIFNSTLLNLSDISEGNVYSLGINLTSSNYNNITNVNITNMTTQSTSGSGCYDGSLRGVSLSSSENVTINNLKENFINGTFRLDGDTENPGCQLVITTTGDGVIISSSSHNFTIFNSTFNTIGAEAIDGDSSGRLNITLNTITNAATGIETTNENTGGYAVGNNISKSSVGIDISSSGSWTVQYNNVNFVSSKGISVSGIGGYVDHNVVNHINSSSSSVGGITMGILNTNSFDNNTVYNASFSTPSSSAIYVTRNFNGTYINVTNATNGFYFSGSNADNSNLTNSSISETLWNSTYISGASNVNYYNVTHDTSKINISSGSFFNYYYLQVNVTDHNYAALNVASVNVTNNTGSGSPEIQTTTGSNGLTQQLVILTFNQSSSGVANHTPHNISASKTGYSLNWTREALDRSRLIWLLIHTPEILSYIPTTDTFSIAEPSNQTFSIIYTNQTPVHIRWFVNNTENTTITNTSQFIWYGNYTQQGTYQIKVNISNADGFDEQIWTMTVNDTNPAPTHTTPLFDVFPPANSQNFSCLNQSTSDANGDNVTNIYNWLVNGNSTTVLNMPFDTNISVTTPNLVKDYSGNGNNGTLNSSSALIWTSNGRVGGAYNFSGNSGSIIRINDSSSLSSTQNLTVMAWIKPALNFTGAGLVRTILVKRNSTTFSYRFNIDDTVFEDGKLDFLIMGVSHKSVRNNWTKDTWYHVSATYNKSHVVLYVDGVVDNTVAETRSISYDGNPLDIGGQNNNSLLFNGTIDDVRIYNRSLSSSQIYQIYLDTQDGLSNKSVIVGDETLVNENWTCQVTPNDAYQDGTTLSNSTNITSAAIAMSLSSKLAQQINWTLTVLPTVNQSAEGNNGTDITEYYINVTATGGTADVYIRANDNLKTSGGDILGLGNETFNYNLTNSTVPGESRIQLTTNFSDNKIGSNIESGIIYLKFYLNAPAAQPAGIYNNTLEFKGVASGESP